MFILLASFNNLGLVIYQVYVQAHALIGAKMTYQLKRKNCCIYLCLVKYMSVCQLIHRYLAREHFFKGSEGKNKEKNPRAQSRIQVNIRRGDHYLKTSSQPNVASRYINIDRSVMSRSDLALDRLLHNICIIALGT
jgi:hypothetical protein